jgi:hypothetical protein
MDFGGTIQTWIQVLTRPGTEVFEQESRSPNATVVTALIWIVISAVVAAILGFIQFSIGLAAADLGAMLGDMGLPPEVTANLGGLMGGGAGIGALILTPLFFLIGVGIIHLLARVFGGDGSFGVFAYLVASFQAPIGIVSAVLGFVPFVGGCIAALLSIYSLVLTFFAVKVNYQLTDGKAIAVVLIPYLLVFGLTICVAVAVAAMVAGMSF